MLNLHHLRLFHAVAREGVLTAAADRLNLSQSALSTPIKTLEATLGQPLFERRGRGLVLTEAGRIALDHAEAIFRTADDLTATLRETRGARRALRVGALATLSRNFQMQFLALDVVLTNLIPARDAASPWLVHRLGEQPISLVGTPGRIAGRAVADLLATEPLILPTPETALRASCDAWLARAGITPLIAAEVDDMAMIRLLARADAGLAIIPAIVVRDELATGALTEVTTLDGLGESFVAVTLQRRYPNPLLAELLTSRPAP